MKAILLAAGEGKRLRPFTQNTPKCLVEYRGKPILDYVLETIHAVGISDVCLVSGYCAEKIVRDNIKKVWNEKYASTNMVQSLFCASDEISGDVLVSYTDIIYSQQNALALMQTSSDVSVLVDKDWHSLWRQRMEDPLSDAETLKINQDGFIVELGKRPKSLNEIDAQYMGVIKLTKTGSQKILEHYNSLDKTKTYDGQSFAGMYMTSFLQSYIDAGNDVRAVVVKGGWMEFDCVSDLEIDPVSQER